MSQQGNGRVDPQLLRTQGKALFHSMLRVRTVEENIAERYAEQEMRCPVHLSVGQEATAVGVCAALRRDDQIVSTHRNHAHYLAKGGDLKKMLAEMYGKAAGCCGGRGGSMHLFDTDAGVLMSLPIVASSIPIGVGAAFAIRQRGGDQAVVAFMGDASMEEGVWHESANFAALKKLPVIFVCENNLFSVYTRLNQRQPERPMAHLGQAHGMPTYHGDGNEVFAVYTHTMEAVTRARRGEGPSLLILDTYRWREHCGPNYDNDIGYRTEAEFQEWKVRCPVERTHGTLLEQGVLSAGERERMQAELDQEVEAAFAFAKSAPFPALNTADTLLYA